MRKRLSGTLALAALLGPAVVLAGTQARRATLQDRIDAAQPGERIVVRGGRYVGIDVPAGKTGLVLVGRGATLVGATIEADGVRVQGFRIEGRGLVVRAKSAVVVGNELRATSAAGAARTSVDVEGDGAVLTGNRMDRGDVVVASHDAVIDGNRVRRGDVSVTGDRVHVGGNRAGTVAIEGDSAVLENNDLAGVGPCGLASLTVTGSAAAIRSNRLATYSALLGGGVIENNSFSAGGNMWAYGDDVTARSNTFGAEGALVVEGDRAVVVGNTLHEAYVAIRVKGAGFSIAENHVDLLAYGCVSLSQSYGVSVEATGPGGVIERNLVDGGIAGGVHVVGDGVALRNNTILAGSAASAVRVEGARNSLDSNTVIGVQSSLAALSSVAHVQVASAVTGMGVRVDGPGNVVTGNRLGGVIADAIVVSSGSDNVVATNSVTGCAGCGIRVGPDAATTQLDGNNVKNVGSGVVNEADGTTLVDTVVTGSADVDIRDVVAFDVFDGNQFTTQAQDPLLLPIAPLLPAQVVAPVVR